MSNIGVHDFAIPHKFAEPLRDIVLVQLPIPPKMVGSLQIPDIYRDMAVHNVVVGRVVAMGPLAFWYKDGNGDFVKHDVKIGDWIEFRPYAGTQTVGGKVAGAGNWRYLSTFQDAIAKIPADKMPDPATLLWDETEAKTAPSQKPKPEDSFGGEPRERIKVPNARS